MLLSNPIPGDDFAAAGNSSLRNVKGASFSPGTSSYSDFWFPPPERTAVPVAMVALPVPVILNVC